MQHIAVLIEHYGLIVVFLGMLLDQAGLPIPAVPTLMIAAALAVRGGYSLEEIVLAGVAGAVIADAGWFIASRRHGRKLLGLLCKISLSPDSCVRQTENLYGRVGSLSLLFAKFVTGLGIVSIALAAIADVPLAEFALLDAIGAALFVGAAVVLGFLFRAAIFAAIATLSNLGALGLGLAAAALAVYVLARWWQRQAFIRQLRMDRILPEELAELIAHGEAPVIVDVRPDLVRYEEGIIPGAVFAHPLEAQRTLAGYPKDIEVVVYCSCPNEESAATAANHLKRAGFRKIRPLLGGIEAWAKAGGEVAAFDQAAGVAS